MENKLFLFRIDYHHYRTGEPTSTKIGIIKAKDKESAKELIWQDFGNDYATLKDYNIADKINTEKMNNPSFMMVLTGTGDFAYRRKDGVFVVPIGCLKD